MSCITKERVILPDLVLRCNYYLITPLSSLSGILFLNPYRDLLPFSSTLLLQPLFYLPYLQSLFLFHPLFSNLLILPHGLPYIQH